MTAVDNAVREFSITLYPPTTFNTIFLCVALVVLLAAGTWLGMRFYLHMFGEKTDGKVIRSYEKSSLIKEDGFQISKYLYTTRMTIEFTGPDGEKHTVKGTKYSDKWESDINRTVPVLYSRAHPAFAMYYDPIWHYITPIASLAMALILIAFPIRTYYEDLRNKNALSLADSVREHREEYSNVISQSNFTIRDAPEDADAYERRGDAQFGDLRFRDAIKDYSEALRLRPGNRELLLKRAKAEWLEGRDSDALSDWLKYR